LENRGKGGESQEKVSTDARASTEGARRMVQRSRGEGIGGDWSDYFEGG